jgi:DNA-binding NtrC family response regulator
MVHPIRVLVVDDDPAIRDVVAELLAGFGFQTKVANNGRAALKLIGDARPFDVVLADVVMPDIGGVQLADLLAEKHPELPVVLMTGRDSMVQGVIDAGAVALIKPFTALQLKRIIEDVLDLD